MLTAEQVRRIAREEGLSAGVMEKDYAITWLLRGYYLGDSRLRRSLVLKGGTAIRKVYYPRTLEVLRGFGFHRCQNRRGGEDKGIDVIGL